jgi:pSer/pThr/pTyr-binding forkhead associated (FHA) protein
MITASRETVARQTFSAGAVLEDARTGKQISLAGYATSVGRCSHNDIYINDFTVSRQHAIIYYRNGSYFIQDLESRNGTKVDGIQLTDRAVELTNGCRIIIGLTQYIFSTSRRAPRLNACDTAELACPVSKE